MSLYLLLLRSCAERVSVILFSRFIYHIFLEFECVCVCDAHEAIARLMQFFEMTGHDSFHVMHVLINYMNVFASYLFAIRKMYSRVFIT